MRLPPFLDETIYIRWLRTIKETGNWFLPLQEFGWAPLTTWISTLVSQVIKDNLLSLRLTAGLFGGLSLIVAYRLAKSLFNDNLTSFLTVLLILLSPIVLIHDRLGLRGDTAVTFTALLMLYGLSQRLIKKKTNAVYLVGIAIALGLLIKSTAWIFPLITLIAYLAFRPKLSLKDGLAGLLSSSSLIFYYLTDSLSGFVNKTSVFLVPSSQTAFLARDNAIQIFQWSYQYLSISVLLLILFGAGLTFKKNRQVWLLLTISTFPVVLFDIVFAKILFPRYLLFTAVIALFFAGYGLSWIWQKMPKYLSPILMIVFIPILLTDIAIIKDIPTAKIPEIERWQYVTGWPSGYGLRELSDYLKTDSPDILIVENNDLVRSGLPYIWPGQKMEIMVMADGMTLSSDQKQYLQQEIAATKTVMSVLNINENLPDDLRGELIKQFPRPENKSAIRLYSIETINSN